MPRYAPKPFYTAADAVTGQQFQLAMQELRLTGEVLPVGARLWVQHRFESGEEKPVEVIYSFPLPRDAALRRFRIEGPGYSVKSELKPTAEAEEDYENGIEAGHFSGMARLHRDGLASLMLGNLRPGEAVTVTLEVIAGVEIRDDGLRFRFPFTLAPAYYPRAQGVQISPGRGGIELPEDEFGDLILPYFSGDAETLHRVGFDLSIHGAGEIVEIASPSHGIRVGQGTDGSKRVQLAVENDIPNRDLVLDARMAEARAQFFAGAGSDGRGRFAAVLPSATFGSAAESPRRVMFVLDRSYSMHGAPLRQAKRAIGACLAALSDQDQFGLMAFDHKAAYFVPGQRAKAPVEDDRWARLRIWRSAPPDPPLSSDSPTGKLSYGTMQNRAAAEQFLDGIEARGGTELAMALDGAFEMLGKAPGEVFLVTDGQVLGGEDIFRGVQDRGIRVHCLGIGSASQDRFLSLLARRTGGLCRFLTPQERVDLEAVDLFASIGRTLAEKLRTRLEPDAAENRIAPTPPDAVYAGTPLVLMGECAADKPLRLALRWERDGRLLEQLVAMELGEQPLADTLRLIQGARLITDFESRHPTIPPRSAPRKVVGAADRRSGERIRRKLEALSMEYGLASRAAALVAVVDREDDREGELPATRVVAVGMPADTTFEAYFRASSVAQYAPPDQLASSATLTDADFDMIKERIRSTRPHAARRMPARARDGLLSAAANLLRNKPDTSAARVAPADEKEEGESRLFVLARSLEPDGGMPGDSEDARVLASVLALLSFLSEGHSPKIGAFRAHVRKLAAYLEKTATGNEVVAGILTLASEGKSLPGDWIAKAPTAATWDKIERVLPEQTVP